MEIASNDEDKYENLFEVEPEETQPLSEETEPETPTNEPNQETAPKQINVRGPITPQVRDLYRSLFPGRNLELIAYEDDISGQEEAA